MDDFCSLSDPPQSHMFIGLLLHGTSCIEYAVARLSGRLGREQQVLDSLSIGASHHVESRISPGPRTVSYCAENDGTLY
jgi:hypothetical protein